MQVNFLKENYVKYGYFKFWGGKIIKIKCPALPVEIKKSNFKKMSTLKNLKFSQFGPAVWPAIANI